MKSSKTEIHSRVHSLPEIRFDDQRLTSCSGLAVFQSHFQSLELRKRLRSCFSRGKQVTLWTIGATSSSARLA